MLDSRIANCECIPLARARIQLLPRRHCRLTRFFLHHVLFCPISTLILSTEHQTPYDADRSAEGCLSASDSLHAIRYNLRTGSYGNAQGRSDAVARPFGQRRPLGRGGADAARLRPASPLGYGPAEVRAAWPYPASYCSGA